MINTTNDAGHCLKIKTGLYLIFKDVIMKLMTPSNISLSSFLLLKTVPVILFLILFSPNLIAQELVENDPEAPFGLVYFLRGKNYAGSATAFSAIIDENRVCKLNNRRYSMHEVEPGEHEFKAQFGGKKGKKKAEISKVEIKAGETYYFQMIMHMNFWYGNVYPQEITRNGALRLLENDKLKLDPYCGEEIGKEETDKDETEIY